MEKNNEITTRNTTQHDASGENVFIETYADDMAKVIKDDKSEGLIKKMIHVEEEHLKEKRKLSPEFKKNKFFMFMGLVLILATSLILYFFISTKDDQIIYIEKQFTPIIFNDASTFVEVSGLTKDQIATSVLNEVKGTKVKSNGVEGIYLVNNKQDIGLRDFFMLIKGNFIPGDNSIFINDNFLMGVVNGASKDFFMILKMRSTSDIFDALRVWESKMFFDLHGFFGVDITPETKYLLMKEFQNGIIENKNARILYDDNDKIVMMYIFAENTSVIVANTEITAKEIMSRLASSTIKK